MRYSVSPMVFADQFRPEAEGKFLNPDLEQTGHQKMPQFMEKDQNSQDNDKCNNIRTQISY